MTVAALGILVATPMSFATRPPVPQTRVADDRLTHVASPIDIVAANIILAILVVVIRL